MLKYLIVMSYTKLIYHIVFRTKHSIKAINKDNERDLYAYIYGIATNYDAYVYRIGGMPDHIHILLDLPPKTALSDFMQDVKKSSSKWIKESKKFPLFEGWGEGYAAFSYSQKEVNSIIKYIKNQKEHHCVITFAEEYRNYLMENGVEIDEKYFLKD